MQRFIYLDCLRVFAAFAVVVVHVAVVGWSTFKVDTLDWQFLNLFNGLSRWCVPMFVMISGSLFLDPRRSLSIRDVYAKYVLRIATVIALWFSALLVLKLAKCVCKQGLSLDSLAAALRGTEYPPGISWFLFMLLGIYAVSPVLKHAVGDRKTLLYVVCASLALNTLSTYAPLLPHGEWLALQIKQFSLEYFLGYIGYFCAGAYLRLYPVRARVRAVLYGLGVFGAAVTVAGTSALSLSEGRPNAQLCNCLTPNVAFMSFALFCLFMRHGPEQLPGRAQQALSEVSKATLLIYVLHCYIIVGLRSVGISVLSLHGYMTPVIAAIAFALSFALARVLLCSRWVGKLFA